MANRVLCIEIGNRMTHVVETDFKVKEPKIYKSFSFQTPDNLFKEETLADVLPFKERLDAGPLRLDLRLPLPRLRCA